jgi:hypothetical protein
MMKEYVERNRHKETERDQQCQIHKPKAVGAGEDLKAGAQDLLVLGTVPRHGYVSKRLQHPSDNCGLSERQREVKSKSLGDEKRALVKCIQGTKITVVFIITFTYPTGMRQKQFINVN